MARGSQDFAWKDYGDVERVCAVCGVELVASNKPLRPNSVARVHFSGGATRFYCVEHMHEDYT